MKTVAEKPKKPPILLLCLLAVLAIPIAYLGRGFYFGAKTIHELLTENKHLKQAITNLTNEDQIGYAKVLWQGQRDGDLYTTVRFAETARDDKLKIVLQKDYTITGDIVHFDALIVKFGDKMVMDGQKKALYLWRRIYSDRMSPEQAFIIEEPGTEPQRYKELLALLGKDDRDLFWSNIWDLANDPDKLKAYDIEAVYGHAVYTRLQPGIIYIFEITPAGQLYPEIIPDI